MTVGLWRRKATARRALQEALLHEERLIHFFDSSFIFADGSSYCLHSNRAAFEFLNDCLENSGIHVVETELIDVEKTERILRYIARDAAT